MCCALTPAQVNIRAVPRSDIWRPGASLTILRARAALYQQLRDFFARRDVLEVVVPVLGLNTAPDATIHSLSLSDQTGRRLYLQPSPEHFLKRLVAGVQTDLYSLGAAFRQDEQGSHHNPEFALLEWYRCGYSCEQLMAEVAALIDLCLGKAPFARISYRALLRQIWQVDVLALSAEDQKLLCRSALDADLPADAVLDALYAEALRRYARARFFVQSFPPDQAMMAELIPDETGAMVAARFECIVDGLELANGYQELTDCKIQAARWLQEGHLRKRRGLPEIPADERLLTALPLLPPCAGVALGVDRLLMLHTGETSLDKVLSFSAKRL